VSLPYQQQQQVAPRAPILIRQFVIVEDFYIDLPPVDEAKPRLHLSHDDVTESLKDTTYGQQLLIQLLIHEEVTSHKTIAIKYVHSDENYADMMTKCLAAPKTSKGFNGTCLKSLGKEWRSYRKTVHIWCCTPCFRYCKRQKQKRPSYTATKPSKRTANVVVTKAKQWKPPEQLSMPQWLVHFQHEKTHLEQRHSNYLEQ
jgi:hypothetical protein